MLKIVHLLTGVAALLLSFIPSLQQGSPPYLEQHDALYLALFGLLNLTLAPVIPYWNKGTRHQLQNLVSALLVLTVVVQTLTLLAPMPEVGGHPAILSGVVATGRITEEDRHVDHHDTEHDQQTTPPRTSSDRLPTVRRHVVHL